MTDEESSDESDRLNIHLRQDERITFLTKIHKWHGVIAPLLSSSSVWLFFNDAPFITEQTTFIAILSGYFLWKLLNYTNSLFVVTTQRVIIRTGVIRRNSVELLLQKIEGVDITDSILDLGMDCGKITISGTGGTKHTLSNVANHVEFRRYIYDAIENRKI